MRDELQEKLFNDFPELFSLREDKRQAISWGITCGDGWFDIVYSLSKRIAEVSSTARVVQIKSKFGGLRYYLAGGSKSEKVWKAIRAAEVKSQETCEQCGKPAVMDYIAGWVWTTCSKKCREELSNRIM